MNLMIQPNQVCFNSFKLYNNRPELLPDSSDILYKYLIVFNDFTSEMVLVELPGR